MDDLAEQHELANEIGDAISSPVGFGQDYDEVSEATLSILLYSLTELFIPWHVCRRSSMRSWRHWSRRSWITSY